MKSSEVMKTLKSRVFNGLLAGLLFSAIFGFQSFHRFASMPNESDFDHFQGQVLEYKQKGDSDIWTIKASNKLQTLTFYIIEPKCECMDDALKAGDEIAAKLDHRLWLISGIRAWELKRGPRSVVSMSESIDVQYGSVSDWWFRQILTFFGVSIVWIALIFSRKQEVNQ